MQGHRVEETGLSAIAGRKTLATAEGVYDDIRRGFPRGDNEVYSVLLRTVSVPVFGVIFVGTFPTNLRTKIHRVNRCAHTIHAHLIRFPLDDLPALDAVGVNSAGRFQSRTFCPNHDFTPFNQNSALRQSSGPRACRGESRIQEPEEKLCTSAPLHSCTYALFSSPSPVSPCPRVSVS